MPSNPHLLHEPPGEPGPSAARQPVAIVLRCLGWLDLCALFVVAAPVAWIEAIHAFVGLGPFPQQPIAAYLVRTSPALYALHGALCVYLSYDVDRYWKVIRFLALAAIVLGAVVFAIDANLELPRWWRLSEGPGLAAIGATLLALQWRADRQAAEKTRDR